MQTLTDLGYEEAAQSVSESSGYALESQAVTDFRRAVLGGNWSEAERLLLGSSTNADTRLSLGYTASGATSVVGSAEDLTSGVVRSASSNNGQAPSDAFGGLQLVPGADRDLMRFGIRQQKYLECLQEGDTVKALTVLRNELTPLHQDKQRLQFLSSLLMSYSTQDLMARAKWDGAHGQSRPHLLSELSRFVSPSVMLPEHRLAVLLRQTKDVQVSGCVFHTTAASPSLYTDHACDKSNFPTHVLCELVDSSSDEVWQVRFSGDGKYLASCGMGQFVNIYEVPSFKLKMRLDGHTKGAGDISWSPDDSKLISCGRDGCARMWDMATGLLIRLFEHFAQPITGCVWSNDNETIVLGSLDMERGLAQWKVTGERVHNLTQKHRTEALAMSPDGLWLVAMDTNKRVHVYNYLTQELEYNLELDSRAVSIAISEDSQFLLVLRQDGEIHMFSIRAHGSFVHKYVGATVGECVVRATFGGADESFVISGSEGKCFFFLSLMSAFFFSYITFSFPTNFADGNLNIWHKNLGAHLFQLEAHKPRCNAIAWSPTDPCLFATCGDDGKIKLYVPMSSLSIPFIILSLY